MLRISVKIEDDRCTLHRLISEFPGTMYPQMTQIPYDELDRLSFKLYINSIYFSNKYKIYHK